MKFYKSNIDNLVIMLDKIHRFFAYKYEVNKNQVALVIKGRSINIMIDGKLKESFLPKILKEYSIDEETGLIKKIA